MSEDKPKKRKRRASSSRRSPRSRDVKLTVFALATALGNPETQQRARAALIKSGSLIEGYNNLLTAVALYCTKTHNLTADPVEISEIRSWISQENRKRKEHNAAHKSEHSFKSIKPIPSLKDKLKDPTPADIIAEKNAEVDRIAKLLQDIIND